MATFESLPDELDEHALRARAEVAATAATTTVARRVEPSFMEFLSAKSMFVC
jgi:hypothetical protein